MIFKFVANLKQNKIGLLASNIRNYSSMKFLNQEEAINVDVELFNDYKFSGMFNKNKTYNSANKSIYS